MMMKKFVQLVPLDSYFSERNAFLQLRPVVLLTRMLRLVKLVLQILLNSKLLMVLKTVFLSRLKIVF